MKKRIRLLSVLMATVMVFSTAGCGSSGKVNDFYLQENKEWSKEHALSDQEVVCNYSDDKERIVKKRAESILEDSSVSSGQDAALQKVSALYEQLLDATQRKEQGNARIRELMDRVEAVENLQDFYQLMQDPEMSLFNHLMVQKYILTNDDRYKVFYDAEPVYGFHNKTKEQYEILEKGIKEQFLLLGYSSQEAERIAANVVDVDEYMDTYIDLSKDFLGYNVLEMDKEVTGIPVADIMKAQDLSMVIRRETYYIAYAREDYFPWMKIMVEQGNLQEVKDYYRMGILEELVSCGSDELQRAYRNTRLQLGGATKENADAITKEEVIDSLQNFDKGVLANRYAEQYITEEITGKAEDITKKLQSELVNRIKGIEWFGTRLQEKEVTKVKLTKVYWGQYEDYNTLEDVSIGECAVDTAISFLLSNREYDKRFLQEGRFVTNDIHMLSADTCYDSASNSIFIGAANLLMEEDCSEEQYMGSLGIKLARKLARTFDYYNFYYDSKGMYLDFVNDEMFDRYRKTGNAVYDKIHEKSTGNGNTTDGSLSAKDGIVELLALESCIQIMEQQDTSDLKRFFESYAKENAQNIRKEEEIIRMNNGEPLRPKVGVNYAVSQVAEYYDCFEVNVISAYYTGEKKRVNLFQY